MNNLQEVSDVQIAEMELQVDARQEENEYQEYFHYLMESNEILYPTTPNEAFNVFQQLMIMALRLSNLCCHRHSCISKYP